MNLQTLENEVTAWRTRFPQYEYRPQDECVALKLEHVRYGCHCELEPGALPDACVLNEGRAHDCVHAQRLSAEGKQSEKCPHWKPVTIL